MQKNRIRLSSVIENQFPQYIREEFPLMHEFITEYYKSIDNHGGILDILQNIDQYIKLDNLTSLEEDTTAISDIDFFDTEIKVESIKGFPDYYGLISIDDEIIGYEKAQEDKIITNCNISIGSSVAIIPGISQDYVGRNVIFVDYIEDSLIETVSAAKIISISDDSVQLSRIIVESDDVVGYNSNNTYKISISDPKFVGCRRGFVGISSYKKDNKSDELVFSETSASSHTIDSKVENLSILFLKEFYKKIKFQIAPGFEDRSFTDNLNQNIFIKQLKDFYSSKGTDDSFKILFKALYGEEVSVIKPRDYLIKPSDAEYRITRDIVVKELFGNPLELVNRTLFQDESAITNAAYGSVTNVEKISRNGKEYYILSLDYGYDKDIDVDGSIFGTFSIHPKTYTIDIIDQNSSTLTVDSTVGFPNSGTLIVDFGDNIVNIVTYKSKSYNQFFECEGIINNISLGTEVRYNISTYSYLNAEKTEKIEIIVTGVLSDLKLLTDDSVYYDVGDTCRISSLGINELDPKFNNWFFNIPTSHRVESFTDEGNFNYNVITYDVNNINESDLVELDILFFDDGLQKSFRILKTFETSSGSIPKKSFKIINDKKILEIYNVRKIVLKVVDYPYTANIQNIYKDFENSLYVASPSLPNYLNQKLNINLRSVEINGIFPNQIDDKLIVFKDQSENVRKHNFLTGDTIIYNPKDENNRLNIQDGVYFVKKIDDFSIKIASSKENLFNLNFLRIEGQVLLNKFDLFSFVDNDLNLKNLESHKIVRKISNPEYDGKIYDTESGKFKGIFVNGVEIVDYKSEDSIFYGPIVSIDVTNGGKNYDVINPPELLIEDFYGNGAKGLCSVEGSLKKINVIDSGFDYIEEPKISIFGGNGFGAVAKANLITEDHFVDFYSNEFFDQIDLNNNIIKFLTSHKFRDGEKIVYDSNNQTSIGGIISGSSYYISVKNSTDIALHSFYEDSILGINTVSLTSFGNGQHTLKSLYKKKKVGSISIINSGSEYRNNKVSVAPIGVSTYSGIIECPNHKYKSGDILVYENYDSPIGGLNVNEQYIVTVIDENKFKLSNLGSESILSDFYYRTKQYIDFSSSGIGTHIFNHPKIEVKISGKTGVSTLTGQNFNAVLQPIFSGKINSIFIENSGVGYGSSEIINYSRPPKYTLLNGKNAVLYPIISEGKIIDVLVSNSGFGYNSPPEIVVYGSGKGCVLTSIVTNGRITNVKIVSSGIGYSNKNTILDVIPNGQDCKLNFTIKPWNINLVERLISSNLISDDDGIITKGLNTDFGVQYSHAYAPRKLRSLMYAKKDNFFRKDIENDTSPENNLYHSPIIGWSYDGCPIYGPYGYETPLGGKIKQLKSGYEIIENQENRPNLPLGFFVEDYIYSGNGDLDQYNGRFCKTPEYPNGIYAYFSTVSSTVLSTEPFVDYKAPQFPYVIGNSFKFKPIEFNFDKKSNQDNIKLENTDWLRNTSSYYLNSTTSNYDYIFNPNSVKKQFSDVTYAITGSVDSISIPSPGNDYKVDDPIIFDNENTNGQGAYAEVSYIEGRSINDFRLISKSISSVEFFPNNKSNEFISFSPNPHELKNVDKITISGLSTNIKSFNQYFDIEIYQNKLSLNENIGELENTGIVTYFSVIGNLNYPHLKENDIFKLDQEKIKILNIDKLYQRIKVLRGYDDTIVSSHNQSTLIIEEPRKFKFSLNINNDSREFNYQINRELYFNPRESLGIGTQVGLGTTSSISNVIGIGLTQIFIPSKSIYLKDHQLNTNDSIKYNSNDNIEFKVSLDGLNSFVLENQSLLYVAKISDDFIGISTVKVGVSTTGSFVGIGTTNSTTLYFNDYGEGLVHSFKTIYDNVLSGSVNKNEVFATTNDVHKLNVGDIVVVNSVPNISKNITIEYNDVNRRILIDPQYFNQNQIFLNQIILNNHGFYNGEKIIYNSDFPCLGLENNKIYYIILVDENKFKLTTNHYQTTLKFPQETEITSNDFIGKISKINPNIKAVKNNNIIFDVSHQSLSFSNGTETVSAFDFKLFKDKNLTNDFIPTGITDDFEVIKSGEIGITSTARVELKIKNSVNYNLYYNLIPTNDVKNIPIKSEIYVDSENIVNNNKISISDSLYSGEYIVSGIGSTSFMYNLKEIPEKNYYNSSEGSFTYITNSKTESGGISKVKIKSKGQGYKKLPIIDRVISKFGSEAILIPSSNDIGKIKSYEILDIGFDYSVDKTIRPLAKFPDILKVEPLTSIKNITVEKIGNNYNIAPDLIVIDSFTNKVVKDVILEYSLEENKVLIIQNTKGFYDVEPKIIPINNSNGVGISSVSLDSEDNILTVYLNSSFSDIDAYPFRVGDRVLIENTVVIDGNGYNSSEYNYELFPVVEIESVFGSSQSIVKLNLNNHLIGDEVFGEYDESYSFGKIIAEKDFPVFSIELQKNQFLNGEVIFTKKSEGIVENWDEKNEYLRAESEDFFEVGDLITGKSSKSKGLVSSVRNTLAIYDVNSSSIVKKGWNKDTGFLNNTIQRIHDNDYYQYFSYSIKSKVPYEVWDNSVNSLNHTTGFKQFSDLNIVSQDQNYSGIQTSQNNAGYELVNIISEVIDTNCVYDFDLSSEVVFDVNQKQLSNEIIFNSREIQDYSESIGNRVLVIDDISPLFDDSPREDAYSIVDKFLSNRFFYKKYIIYVADKRYTSEKQISLVTALQDNENTFINQYSTIYTTYNLGFFDSVIEDNSNILQFYPINFENNDYDISSINYNFNQISSGVGTVYFGDIVSIASTQQKLINESQKQILSIPISERSSKILIEIIRSDGKVQFNELNIIHDDSNTFTMQFGTLHNLSYLNSSYVGPGFGTYYSYISNSSLNIDFISDEVSTFDVNSLIISMSDVGTGIGTENLISSSLDSHYTNILSSSSPTLNSIASYSNKSGCAYYLVSIKDTTTNSYQFSELVVIHNSIDCYFTEFGIIKTNDSLGTFDASVTGDTITLYFIPNPNINVEVRVFQNQLKIPDTSTITNTITI